MGLGRSGSGMKDGLRILVSRGFGGFLVQGSRLAVYCDSGQMCRQLVLAGQHQDLALLDRKFLEGFPTWGVNE